ncbi:MULTISPECIES: YlxM family DNA-binding protein [Erysipelothrix]|uniref:YlxM family DNA-binding protein n=1 Tax=Erysipelothrix TaxID=1647 RepID=UPI001F4297DE|nr:MULTISPECIES: sigma factor-like helix-turn-helix DNA-binding protein [Erysipelothrix]
MNIEKTVFLNKLFDYYEKLLTQRQQEVFRYYYHDDLSYQEIADILGISRAAVFDNLNRTSKLLIEYEEKLGVANGYQTLFDKLYALENNDVNAILDTFIKGRKL